LEFGPDALFLVPSYLSFVEANNIVDQWRRLITEERADVHQLPWIMLLFHVEMYYKQHVRQGVDYGY